ncbi:unnamed protein product [Lampetra planeri]
MPPSDDCLPLFFAICALLFAPATQANFAPFFHEGGNMAFTSLSEDTAVGTQVFTLNGSDPEGARVTYGMEAPPGQKEVFAVEPRSGNVTLVAPLDRERVDELDVMVSISDGLNTVVEKARVFVTDVNDEPPVFDGMPYTVTVPEDCPSGASLLRVTATDRDAGSGGSILYHLQGARGLFAVDRHSGVLRLKPNASLDYERERAHTVTVVAQDGGGRLREAFVVFSASALVTVGVSDVQDTPPAFVGMPYHAVVYEDTPSGADIFTVVAYDGDQAIPNPIRYSVVNGSNGLFLINETTGAITVPDVTRLNEDSYQLFVQADEVGASPLGRSGALAGVAVTVVDVNDHSPVFSGPAGPQHVFRTSVRENPPLGEVIRGLNITVSDGDKGANAKFRLRVLGAGAALRVVPGTVLNEAPVALVVTNSAAFDYERTRSIRCQIVAEEMETVERRSSAVEINIDLEDINDNVPSFSRDHYVAKIRENSPGGSIVTTAVDPDSGKFGKIRYTLAGEGADMFLIHPSKGVLYTQPWAELDAETQTRHHLAVRAEDGGGLFGIAEVLVAVTDVNEHPPAFSDSVLEEVMVIGRALHILATDGDAEAPNNVVRYSLERAEPLDVFELDTASGELRLRPSIRSLAALRNLTHRRDCRWSLLVQAKDGGTPAFSSTAVLRLDITEESWSEFSALRSIVHRDNPMRALGVLAGLAAFLVALTALISTAAYCRNKKSNRVAPHRRRIVVASAAAAAAPGGRVPAAGGRGRRGARVRAAVLQRHRRRQDAGALARRADSGQPSSSPTPPVGDPPCPDSDANAGAAGTPGGGGVGALSAPPKPPLLPGASARPLTVMGRSLLPGHPCGGQPPPFRSTGGSRGVGSEGASVSPPLVAELKQRLAFRARYHK